MSTFFPTYDITGRPPARFRKVPIDWKQITEEYQYEDGGKDFNEIADIAPYRWEYGLTGLTQTEADYYDAFFNSVRFTQPFLFTDKWGTTWTDVRIETYDRNHDAHKSWMHTVNFGLVSYTGNFLTVPVLTTLTVIGPFAIRADWLASLGDVSGYDVLIDSTTILDAGDFLTYTYSFFGPGTLHQFQVRSKDILGNYSGWSNALSATTDASIDIVLVDDDSATLFDSDSELVTDG